VVVVVPTKKPVRRVRRIGILIRIVRIMLPKKEALARVLSIDR